MAVKKKSVKAPPASKSPALAVVFDTETTGLVQNHTMKLDRQPEIIELYACQIDLNNGKVVRDYHTIIRPTVEYPMSEYTIKATKTKLSNELLKDAPKFREVSDAIRNFLELGPMIIAHNLSFDMEMCDIEFERLDSHVVWPAKRVCTVEQTLHLKGHRLSLTKLYQHLFDNEEFADAHRAQNDVAALCRCAVELYKRELI